MTTYQIILPHELPQQPTPKRQQPVTQCSQPGCRRPAQGHLRHNGRPACFTHLIAAGKSAAGREAVS